MNKIKLTLPAGETPINAKMITFIAPCSCATTQSIEINSQIYTVVDALGRTIAGIGGYWDTNALVTITLDVTHHKAYLQNAPKLENFSCTATISSTWVGSTAPYTQLITATGVKTTDLQVHITPVYSTTNTTAILEKKAWNCIDKAEVTAANQIKLTCFKSKPEISSMTISLEVIR